MIPGALRGGGASQEARGAARVAADAKMWKSVCLAAGIFACVIGLELLVIDSAVVLPIDGRGSPQVVMAPDWAPWSLISAGAVTLLNFGTLPTRASKDLAKLAKE